MRDTDEHRSNSDYRATASPDRGGRQYNRSPSGDFLTCDDGKVHRFKPGCRQTKAWRRGIFSGAVR
ncbi:hypothetical protein QNH46_22475 [Paenibacillus woosongensis]|uniref:Uncharacterized protein n=1 Tax=Paenibacillus woosongensis TaxID=307580 RepID=A0AA95I797_9BACL|nr:hypothetical protein [Paenibacillus woosongensis]WHX48784.1 hypothetical protein QNH46_22475 [Paenibacillus woosongensis]